MPEDHIIPAGDYRIRKRFRNEEVLRRKRDLPWSKKVLDLDHNKLFGRTPWGWCRIIGFYLVLYLLLALIVVFWILIFVHFMYKPDRPLWLKGAPGVSIVPTGVSNIDFHPHDEREIDPIADNIDRFFNKVEASERSQNVFDVCNRDKTWGYYAKEPCVFVKLNKVYGFEPETYESESELPEDSPSEIADLMAQYGGFAKIWLTCDATDEENSPSINYIPYPYFDTSTDMKGLNRVVALQLSDIPTNEDITIICKVWAKNIRIDMEYRGTGHTRFTIKMRGKA